MQKVYIFLILVFSVYAEPEFDSRFIGVVSQIKIINVDDQNNVVMWLKTDKEYSQHYLIKGISEIPQIYINDSLYEYWVNYKKIGLGTKRNVIIYEIINQKLW